MERVDELLRVESWKLKQFEDLGLSMVEAIDAVSQDIDPHDVATFIKFHPECSPQMAVHIV